MPTDIRILIVDDHASVRDGVRAFLEARTSFIVCGEAEDGTSAVTQANLLKPDVIILDLALPMLNGVEAASVLKNALPEVKIVAFSVYAEELGRAIRSATKIDAVIPKASTLAQLVETIQQVLALEPPLKSEPPGQQPAPSA